MRRAAFLGEKDHARADLIDRTTRAIRRDQDVAAGSEHVDQLHATALAPLREARSADGAVTGAFDEKRTRIAIAAGTDQDRCFGRAGNQLIKTGGDKKEAVVPDGANVTVPSAACRQRQRGSSTS